MHRTLLVAAVMCAVTACTSSEAAPVATQQSDAHGQHANGAPLTSEQKKGVADVTRETARFREFDKAKAAGYTKQYPAGCAESPEGAQGFHYLNESLVDAKVELLKPELVMYEPQPNGRLKLIGVDYVVPLTSSATPPTLLGVPFMRNDPLGVWALHIWTERQNPSGMFAAWNPKVSCKDASKVTP
jgi:hypothetical protein